MAGYTYAELTDDIRNYTEVDANVFTAAVINRFIENAEFRINLDCPMDSDRIQAQAQFVANFNTITMPKKHYLLEVYKYLIQQQLLQNKVCG